MSERRGKFSKEDFKAVKHMQKLNWKKQTIIDKTSWSRTTIERALESSTWSVYRGKLSRENKKRREHRGYKEAEKISRTTHSNDAGTYTPSLSLSPYTLKKSPNYILMAYLVILIGVAVLLYLKIK